tara:strand:- start:1357 stop:1875 length:519 start_codon:yes stop_codon:yes gene_type:complete
METLEKQKCPFCGKNTLTLREDTQDIPYFGKTFIMSMDCSNCKYAKSDLEAAEYKDPIKTTLTITEEKDMKIRIVKSSEATIKLPSLRLSVTPGPASEGFISNVEGVIKRFEDIIEKQRDTSEDKADKTKAKNLLKKLRKVMYGEIETKLVIEDPTGNSAIISEKAVVEKLK